MTRTLVLIAFAGFILAVACIAGAIALGGEALMHHHWGGRHWVVNWADHHGRWSDEESNSTADGSSVTREIAWPGGDRIEFDVPADVHYTQGPGPAKLVITGPKDQVDRVELSGGDLRSRDDDDFDGGRLTVTMIAPDVRHFAINGDNSLAIDGYSQDDFSIDVSGNGKVNAKGKTRAVKLDVSGNGDIDLSGLAAQSADAQISGSGRASLAPTDAANVSISGSGEIDLLTHPAKLNSDVSGSGRIVEGGPPITPAPPATAAPPKPK
jgi:Putative auto-transporter adhesin, head GIN domain